MGHGGEVAGGIIAQGDGMHERSFHRKGEGKGAVKPRGAKGQRCLAEVIGKGTGQRRAAGKAGGPGDLVQGLVSQGQGHSGTVQPHLPHQGHRRHPGHRLKDPVEVKTRQRRHIRQGIQ